MKSVFAALCATAMLGASAHAGGTNLLINAGFEDPMLTTPDAPGAGAGWSTFDNVFTSDGSTLNTGVFAENQVLKMFGFGGVFQDFAASEGQTWNGGAFMLNDSSDQMASGQVAAVNIEWLDASGNQISFISNGTFTGADATVDEWIQQTITGVAPAGTATARLVLITGNFLAPAPGGGAPHFDNAFFEVIPTPGTASLFAIGGLVATRRRRA
ncbi:MAG: hypothetical protein AB8C13_09345 [Phycisphaerales bacterium]